MTDLYRDEDGNYNAPTIGLSERTLVFDAAEGRQVMWLAGRLLLPAGSFIELYDAERNIHGEAQVDRVRLLAGGDRQGAEVCLDCTVMRWWSAQDATRGGLPSGQLAEPDASATLEAWQAYAYDRGAWPADIEGKTVGDLRAVYGS